jgi:hypothetical protein
MKLPKGIQIRNGSCIAYCTTDGKPIRKAVGRVGCITPKQAAQERSDLERQIREGTYVQAGCAPKPAPESSIITCTHLWDAYLVDCTNREKRVDRLKTAWTHLQLPFGAKPATEVSTRDMVQYTSARREAGIHQRHHQSSAGGIESCLLSGGTVRNHHACSDLPEATQGIQAPAGFH